MLCYAKLQWRLTLEISVSCYYWDEVMGPIAIYSKGKFKVKNDDIFLLLSSVEPYTTSIESNISGPHYMKDQIIMVKH